jgi:hypothetical protein
VSLLTTGCPAAQDGMPTTRGLNFHLEDDDLVDWTPIPAHALATATGPER